MNYDKAIKYCLDGEAILFCGSGFSFNAKNLRNTKMKTGSGLSDHFCQIMKCPSMDLEDSSEQFAEKYGDEKLINELQEEFTVKEIAKEHELIANVPWKKIYTTNYDNVLEAAYNKVERKLISVNINQEQSSIPKTGTQCIHLNGFVPEITLDNIWSDILLTGTIVPVI